MRKLTLNLYLMAGLLLAPSVFAYVPGGPIGNGGDAWQTPPIDYGVPGDLLDAPKTIGQEYRRITPKVYYTYDDNFLGFFGTAGATNIDAAFAILNQVSNVDSYTPNLIEWPTQTKEINYSASALGLLDIKSEFLTDMMGEQMGLTSAERYTWTLHSRFLPTGGTCPADEEYIVVMRNLSITPSSLSSVQYSPYVNNTLYSYLIEEFCNAPLPPQALTVPFPVDPFADNYTSVSSWDTLTEGEYYTGLTRDDVAGLRYLYSTNTIYREATTPSGLLLVTTNTQPQQLFGPTQPFSILFTPINTNPPNVIETNFPGIDIISVQTNIVNLITTNISFYFTNQSGSPVFSNTVANGLTNGFYFTNQPGPTVINYDPATFIQIQTFDLGVFADQAVTDSPAILQTLYPGLNISSFIAIPQLTFVTNFVTYLTNLTGAPFEGAPVAKTVISSITSFFGTNYIYSFANVFTNHYYTNQIIVTQNIWITNLIGAPFGSPFVARTNYTTTTLRHASGDFFIIPTNWCGFEVLGVSPVHILPPYGTGPTNTIVFTGFNTNGPVTNPVAGGNAFGLTQNIYDIYTNFNIVLRPGICEPVLTSATVTTTNTVDVYNYVFANVVTNGYSTNSLVTVITTNIAPCPGGSTATLCTNITTLTYFTNVPTGNFYIVPPNLCGFSILSTQSIAITFTTNTFIVATNGVGVTNAGQQYSVTVISGYTNYTFQVLESTCSTAPTDPSLQEGIGHVQFIRNDFDSLIGQFLAPITNDYYLVMITNSQAVTQHFQRVITTPDILLSAQDLVNGGPPIIFNPYSRTVQFDQSTILNNLAGPGTIPPGITFSFNNQVPFYLASPLSATGVINGTNNFLGEQDQTVALSWASFDGSTNAPIVYPNGQGIADLLSQILITVTLTNSTGSFSTMPPGTNGVPYNLTLNVTGGQPPYTLTAPNFSTLVPGLTFNGVTNGVSASISGTPNTPGSFNFDLLIQDSGNRVVNLNYPITIH